MLAAFALRGCHAGQQRTGQCQVSAQGCARERADHQKGSSVARAQQRRPGKRCHGQQHAGQPTGRQAKARHRPQPQRHGEGRAQKVGGEEPGLLHRRDLQNILHEEQHQRGRNGAGDAAHHKHQQQAPEGGHAPGLPQRGPRFSIRGDDGAGLGRTGPGQPAQQEQRAEHHQRRAQSGQQWQQRRQHDAGQSRRFAPGHDPSALQIAFSETRPPGLVTDAELAPGGAGEHQSGEGPGGQRNRRARQRKPQRCHAQRQHQGRERAGRQAPARRATSKPVGQAPQQRIGECIKSPRREQHRAQRRQRHAEIPRVQVGQQHIERQRGKRQRQGQQAVAGQLAAAERGGVGHENAE